MTNSLLERAIAAKTLVGENRGPVSEDELGLVLAWATGEISQTQMAAGFGDLKSRTAAIYRVALILARALRAGQIIIHRVDSGGTK